ncbi:uncharacterized protein [Onthophagus taurus]|uniref:uncharacterized protein isoform X1 n=1 Tax=Onthophagus taurus TaxID=166361 RepID=UPI000C2080A1|nr:uncharacterized protein LOC111414201 isoform X1 [Onthophagus taurus]XP_022901223.1 uncharacterized protein LOC111414201 isoform X1 [Onthophagus taurus]
MVSRRKILSRSRDDLHMDTTFQPPEEEEDVWYQKDKLYKDHIQEVLDKWTQIDDEIWAKVIVLERNRRVAKAYARAPVLTVNGSDDGFDGFRIGLNGFDNPMRDQKTSECKKHIGHGVKIKMDDAGNILIKRVSKCNIFIKNTGLNGENAIGNDVLKLPACALEPEKPFKLFDMKKFQSNINRELKVAYPDRRRLESQCLSAIAFVRNEQELLECPLWVLIINVVAIDMLKSKLPPVQRVMDIRNRPRIPIPDEDPYSVAGVAGRNIGGYQMPRESHYVTNQPRSDKPPKLPPRENMFGSSHDIPKPDYDGNPPNNSKPINKILKPFLSSRRKEKTKDQKDDDPYYCGLRARVPNFVSKSKKESSKKDSISSKRFSITHQVPPQIQIQPSLARHHLTPYHQHPMWHARSFESGIDMDSMESPYNQIYGRLPIPTRGFIPNQPQTAYVSEWD